MRNRLAVALCLLAAAGAEAAEVLYAVNCPKAGTPPVVDGALDDACWNEASVIERLGALCSHARPVGLPPTQCKLLHDAKHLYIGCHFAEPNLEALKERIYNKSIAVHWRDCAEVFLDPEHQRKRFYKLFANPINENTTYRVWDDGWGRYWDTQWGRMEKVRIRAKMHPDSWQFEMAISWSSLKLRPVPGTVVGFNLNRFRFVGTAKGRHRFFTWSARGGAKNNYADYFGHVVLGDLPSPIEELVAVCFPDYKEREIIVPLPDRMIVFDHGKKRVQMYAALKEEAAAWFAHQTQDAAALLSEAQQNDPALRPIATEQKKLAQQLKEHQERFRAVEEFDVGTASDFSSVQIATRKSLEHLREMARVAALIKEVQAERP